MTRRIVALVAVVLVAIGVVYAARADRAEVAATFASPAAGWMPAVPPEGGVTESWFCPGVPVVGDDGTGGRLHVANRTGGVLEGTALVFDSDAGSERIDITVEAWASIDIDLGATLPGEVVGAVVEIENGGALVEQVSRHPAGDSIATCANQTSADWYLADGFTEAGSLDQLVLANPSERTIVVNVEFAVEEGPRSPAAYRGLTVPARSIRLVDLGAAGAGAQSEPVVAVGVHATRGQLVVGRFQHFQGAGRRGAETTLAVPSAATQWWFADGRTGEGTDERFVIYNPGERPVDVDLVFLGVTATAPPDPINVPPREVRVFESASQPDLPDGRHATVVATTTPNGRIVVERVLTTTDGDRIGTTVSAGAPPGPDGLVATRWYVPRAADEPVEDGLVVLNMDNADGTVTVSAVGSSGPVPVPSLTDLPISMASVLAIDLTDPLVAGRELIVESTNRIFVERSVPTGRGDLRTSAWAVPSP